MCNMALGVAGVRDMLECKTVCHVRWADIVRHVWCGEIASRACCRRTAMRNPRCGETMGYAGCSEVDGCVRKVRNSRMRNGEMRRRIMWRWEVRHWRGEVWDGRRHMRWRSKMRRRRHMSRRRKVRDRCGNMCCRHRRRHVGHRHWWRAVKSTQGRRRAAWSTTMPTLRDCRWSSQCNRK